LIRRVDAGSQNQEYVYNPLACLYDHSCVESEQLGKNELSIDVILPQGTYEVIIFDQQENDVRKWLTRDAGLTSVPFTFELQATPIVQNEERVMCGDKLFLSESFIQNRFISEKAGQRFVFEDEVILSLINTTQKVKINPEEDMIMKVSSK